MSHSTELADTCVIPQEMQPLGSEAARSGADVLAGDSGGAHESGRALGHLGKEAGSLEAVAEGSHSSVDAKEKKIPSEKVLEGTEKASQTGAPEAALISTTETTPECAAAGPPSSAEPQEEEEDGASLLEGVTAPSDSSETAPQSVAGDSPEKSQKGVRLFVGAEEQE